MATISLMCSMCSPTALILAINSDCSPANSSETELRNSGMSLPLGSLVRNSASSPFLSRIMAVARHNLGTFKRRSRSATLVADRLRRLKVPKLCRATAMMRERNGELAEFLTSDPKGKLIPEFLSSVSDELAGEQSELIAKMSAVGEHIEHIKEIVAMQQSYAKVSGVFEDLPVAGLVDDALRMNASAFDRHG